MDAMRMHRNDVLLTFIGRQLSIFGPRHQRGWKVIQAPGEELVRRRLEFRLWTSRVGVGWFQMRLVKYNDDYDIQHEPRNGNVSDHHGGKSWPERVHFQKLQRPVPDGGWENEHHEEGAVDEHGNLRFDAERFCRVMQQRRDDCDGPVHAFGEEVQSTVVGGGESCQQFLGRLRRGRFTSSSITLLRAIFDRLWTHLVGWMQNDGGTNDE
mmetsp:Transcript_8049/g.23138  ORF Transcript_8049/g.23138 Transcript_8049/m.23138 type:complete len:210 (-) Transcript_8049:21-650(-)